MAYARRASCLSAQDENQMALADYEQALSLDSKLAEAYNGLAWILATAPEDGIRNGLKAVGHAEQAVSLADQSERFLYMDTLAAAYAEAGRFADAVAMQSKAISLIPEDYDSKQVAQFKARLKSYQARKPWRDK